MTTLAETCRQVADLLAEHQSKLVLAESCTAGLVAASLAAIPGISNYLCGSAVTYRNETKAAWLGVPPSTLNDPGAVSAEVATQMARGVLANTPEATLAAAVTGHLGPDAPANLDGVVFTAVHTAGAAETRVTRHQLQAHSRLDRQREAAACLLAEIVASLRR